MYSYPDVMVICGPVETVPGRKHVVTKRWITPATFQRELGAFHGNAFSVAPNLTQSAYFRPHNRCARIPGLYLVGAGTHPGAGVPGVINGAKATASVVLADFAGALAAAPAPARRDDDLAPPTDRLAAVARAVAGDGARP